MYVGVSGRSGQVIEDSGERDLRSGGRGVHFDGVVSRPGF